METTHSFDGVNPAILSQLKEAKATAAALAEERSLAEESAQKQIAESEAALRDASEALESSTRQGTATSSDSYYGPTSSKVASVYETEIDEIQCNTPDSEGLSVGAVLELDEDGLIILETSKSYVSKSEIVERRKRGMRVWRAQDAIELIYGIVRAVLGCFHGVLSMLGIRRNSIVDETAPLIRKGQV